jgi:hypothetical protein
MADIEGSPMDEDVRQLRHCRMCGLTILPANLSKQPRCDSCTILLEPEFNEKTLCRCGKYHNAPSEQDPYYCRLCMGEAVPLGTPKGEPVRVEEEPNEFEETEL